MTETEVRRLIQSAVASAPSLRQLAKQWGVSPAYLSDCCSRRRAPGPGPGPGDSEGGEKR